MTKAELRKELIMQRSSVSMDEINERSKRIVDQIKKDKRYLDAKIVALFYPMGHEVNLLSLLGDHSKTFRFPRVEKDGIHFYTYNKDISFVRSSFGVMEPPQGIHEDDDIDLMLTPALSIDSNLYRIGYGKGYYDQFLANHRPKHVVGVIFSFLKREMIPHDAYDQKIDDYIEG
ncbi:MAG: 5-formyltetrahydrofolate cyclo-ligase [Tenericutes bacterium GWC2_34_14]|nr:MAG: 5-formyltetrahydrofolate cyclo-ligase [Tenericutes bacterium GWC2_34_14]OHE32926.1 MAG: 5-formyltetrahydrofolate cyclo-ligase [Tenericutes bacterium GWE2_34_108]OHE36109.1 MAG: 5-formyltetrahydrofolate cyclo-ligase [Tenericutes bacterium GWF1_35_14]OHE39332.1 MAG: 5-formyltetrahydrofolate cyclo-ligase [Tenericutes bacterium GWF2_35_184]OHE43815.1 MAG: 5-formyltetrahydrofolate cyclo-ligase [Tenericutes bacterium RIFOXYA12_FULL_35_10]OHE44605.1 MAG: 5-formyltetrahydrofolate cyclo-ligase 